MTTETAEHPHPHAGRMTLKRLVARNLWKEGLGFGIVALGLWAGAAYLYVLMAHDAAKFGAGFLSAFGLVCAAIAWDSLRKIPRR